MAPRARARGRGTSNRGTPGRGRGRGRGRKAISAESISDSDAEEYTSDRIKRIKKDDDDVFGTSQVLAAKGRASQKVEEDVDMASEDDAGNPSSDRDPSDLESDEAAVIEEPELTETPKKKKKETLTPPPTPKTPSPSKSRRGISKTPRKRLKFVSSDEEESDNASPKKKQRAATPHPDSDDALVETSEDERERRVDKLKIHRQITESPEWKKFKLLQGELHTLQGKLAEIEMATPKKKSASSSPVKKGKSTIFPSPSSKKILAPAFTGSMSSSEDGMEDRPSPVKNTWLASNVDSDDDMAHTTPGRKSKTNSPNKRCELIADEASSDNEVSNIKVSDKNKMASPRKGKGKDSPKIAGMLSRELWDPLLEDFYQDVPPYDAVELVSDVMPILLSLALDIFTPQPINTRALVKLITTPQFDTRVVNPARVSDIDNNFNATAKATLSLDVSFEPVICVTYGSVIRSQLFVPREAGGKYVKDILIHPLMQEWQLACGFYGHVYANPLNVRSFGNGLGIGTRHNTKAPVNPTSSSGSYTDRLKNAVKGSNRSSNVNHQGGVWYPTRTHVLEPWDHIPVRDCSAYFQGKRSKNLEFNFKDIATKCPVFEGEIPEASLVGVLHTVGKFNKGSGDTLSTNIMAVMLLARTSND